MSTRAGVPALGREYTGGRPALGGVPALGGEFIGKEGADYLMKITFCGAARTVTGSQYLVELNGNAFLVDCGMFQGKGAFEINSSFAFHPADIQAVVLTHADIDHAGNLPSLVRGGFAGPIYVMHVTTHMAALLLLDSANIQEAEARAFNESRRRNGAPPVNPLYTVEDAERWRSSSPSSLTARPSRWCRGCSAGW